MMNHSTSRPTGLSILATSEVIGGISICVIGGWLIVQSTLSPSYHNTGGIVSYLVVFSILLVLYGAAFARSGYGLWLGKRRGWTWSVALTAIGVLSLATVSIFFLRPGPPYYAQTIVLATVLVLGLLVLGYLWKPQVKAYCTK